MASSDSQRQTVVPETSASIPRVTTSLTMSGTYSRESGTPRRFGSSQVIAFTVTP